jgi:uncharacterized protein
MSEEYKNDYIKYRLDRSLETLNDAKVLIKSKSWNSCINRLYYASYYAVSALLLRQNLKTKTHRTVKSQFSLHFIKTGIVSKEFGQLFSDLADWRNKGDYGDLFNFDEQTVAPLIGPVEDFIRVIGKLILE